MSLWIEKANRLTLSLFLSFSFSSSL
jgi:hypothetical protein